jgi:hypothetical protein
VKDGRPLGAQPASYERFPRVTNNCRARHRHCLTELEAAAQPSTRLNFTRPHASLLRFLSSFAKNLSCAFERCNISPLPDGRLGYWTRLGGCSSQKHDTSAFLTSNRLFHLSRFPLTWEDVTTFTAVLPFCPDHQGRWEELAGFSKKTLGADGPFKLPLSNCAGSVRAPRMSLETQHACRARIARLAIARSVVSARCRTTLRRDGACAADSTDRCPADCFITKNVHRLPTRVQNYIPSKDTHATRLRGFKVVLHRHVGADAIVASQTLENSSHKLIGSTEASLSALLPFKSYPNSPPGRQARTRLSTRYEEGKRTSIFDNDIGVFASQLIPPSTRECLGLLLNHRVFC